MVEQKCSAQDIITKLREAEEKTSQAKTVAGNLCTLSRLRHVNVRYPCGGTLTSEYREGNKLKRPVMECLSLLATG